VPYCQKAPKNPELNGFFHCQFTGVNLNKFSGDQTGNLPLGVSAVNPPGSCPALATTVTAGAQLDTLVTSPGTPIGWVFLISMCPTIRSAYQENRGSAGAAAAAAAANSTAANSTAANSTAANSTAANSTAANSTAAH
jgi:hypothetical protein